MTMTAEQLEELLGKAHPDGWLWTISGDERVFLDEGILGKTARAQSKLRDMAPSLARRVIAAEKLVEALEQAAEELMDYSEFTGNSYETSKSNAAKMALTAYREACK